MQRLRKQLILPEEATLGEGVRVAVLDTGVDLAHPDLAGQIDIPASRSFALHDDLIDRAGHGTHVTGIIVGTGISSNGFYRGVAPAAKVVAFKTCGGDRGGEFAVLAAIEAAIQAGVHIINFSHGHRPKGHPPWIWPETKTVLEEAFIEASRRGILSVVAAGNEGNVLGKLVSGSITRPGGLECVLTVGALDDQGKVLSTSGRGPYFRSPRLRPGEVVQFDHELYRTDAILIQKPDVVVLGDQVTSLRSRDSRRARRDDDPQDYGDPLYVSMSGTSQATAAVSGLVAGIWSLALKHGIDLGTNPGRTLLRLTRRAARPLSDGDAADFGDGSLKWPMLQSTLSDFVNDPQFRETVLHDKGLKLL